jgi:hypothetical protein
MKALGASEGYTLSDLAPFERSDHGKQGRDLDPEKAIKIGRLPD